MTLRTCERENEMLTVLRSGGWPAAADAELRTHVAGCASCSEVMRVKAGLMQMRAETMSAAPLETAGVLWWKAQVRRRYAAQRRLEKPVRGAQVFALLVGLAAGLGLLASQAENGGWLEWLRQVPETGMEWSSAWSGPGWGLIVAVGALAVLGGLVLYLAAGAGED